MTPYHYFRGMADVNNASGPTGNSGFETSSTTLESAADLHLQQTMSVLKVGCFIVYAVITLLIGVENSYNVFC